MTCFPADCRFRHAWRPYQQRVLAEFDRHLDDRHFHVCAAPGAGKTVLGLEALRRLGRPALVLAPTTAIRDQWLARLQQDFLPPGSAVEWVSTDLARPALLTLATYQGLHAARRRLGLARLVEALKAAGVGTLVLDEAHHLRHQWWEVLVAVKAALASPWLVALTATPPFDVAQAEWNRYVTLCGPIDEEVSVAELVKADNLCPHQDYVHFSRPTLDEAAALERFDREVRGLLDALALEPGLVELLAAHPLAVEPERRLDVLARQGEYALALALFLNETAPERCRALLRTLGLADVALPAFHRDWAELLFDGLLFGRDPLLPEDHAVLQDLTRRLRRIGAVALRRVHLRAPPHLQRLLEGSHGKIGGIAEIVELEARADPIGLRALVLCDHIREADFPQPGEPEPVFRHVGVVPVFEHLRRLRLPELRPAVLTGSVVVLPAAALDALAVRLGRAPSSVPMWHAPTFHRIDLDGGEHGDLLAAVTALFDAGEVNLLVGTAALLGEGWDAPALGTLVLASAIGASMRSNQMRGRAIRIRRGHPHKVSNIWHLACLHPAEADDAPGAPPAGIDLARLTRRFTSFAGVGLEADTIETGIERLGLDARALREADCAGLNARMCRLALDRHAVQQAWRRALHAPAAARQRMLLETRVPLRRVELAVDFRHGLRWERLWLLRWWRGRRLRRRLRRIAEALLQALREAGSIASAAARVDVAVGERHLRCRLEGAIAQEASRYADCLRELFELPQAPRYLLRVERATFAVPACLGVNRATAERLRHAFAARLGRCELVHVRGDAGRRALLQARERWIAGRFEEGCDSRLRWG